MTYMTVSCLVWYKLHTYGRTVLSLLERIFHLWVLWLVSQSFNFPISQIFFLTLLTYEPHYNYAPTFGICITNHQKKFMIHLRDRPSTALPQRYTFFHSSFLSLCSVIYYLLHETTHPMKCVVECVVCVVCVRLRTRVCASEVRWGEVSECVHVCVCV